jgi:uncharacterized Rossmann fold enzyme
MGVTVSSQDMKKRLLKTIDVAGAQPELLEQINKACDEMIAAARAEGAALERGEVLRLMQERILDGVTERSSGRNIAIYIPL